MGRIESTNYGGDAAQNSDDEGDVEGLAGLGVVPEDHAIERFGPRGRLGHSWVSCIGVD